MGARSYLTGRLPPKAYAAVRASMRVLPSRRRHDARTRRIEHALGVDRERVVRAGPFTGMRYIDDSIGSSLIPKLLGSYELELHGAIEMLLDGAGVETILDVGSAEGYYAVGFALRCPWATVTAYDSSPRARELCRRMAALNGVADRVRVHGRIAPEQLRRALVPGALVFCDCEGYERTLIDIAKVPELAEANALVELHDFVDPTISTTLAARFAPSHRVELVDSRARDPRELADLLAPVDPADRAHALDEGRPGPMQWAVLTRRQRR